MTAVRQSVTWRILKDSMFIGACLAAVKLAGAWKVILMARVFGATDALDAYLVAFLLPAFLGETIAGSMTGALIPSLIGMRERTGRSAMKRLMSSIASITIVVLSAGAMLLALCAPLILPLIGSGFGPAKRALAQSLFYELLPLIPMGGLSIVWRAALNAEERFTAPALAPGATPLVILAALSLSGAHPSIWLLAHCTVAGMALELVLLAIAIKHAGFPLRPRWFGWEPSLRGVAKDHLPLMAVAAIGHGNILIDQSLAALLGSGSVSALNYGTRLVTVIAGIAGGALSTAAQPKFSRMIAYADWSGLRKTVRTYVALVLLASVPVTVLLIAVSPQLVRILFLGGAFTASAAALVTAVQQFSMLQLPAFILVSMLQRLISSLQANALLMRLAFAALIVNTFGDYILMRSIGLPGIALASTLVQYLSMAYLLIVVSRQIRREA